MANSYTSPYGTTQPQSSFLLETQGYVQGVVADDPSSRLWLSEGILATTETIPMWGGVPITEQINVTGTGSEGLGPTLTRATTQSNCTGFSVFNQMNHMAIGMNQGVPLAGAYAGVGFFRLHSQVRLAVACDPALITTISGAGDAINSQALYWDVTNYRLTLVTSGGNWALPTSIELLSVNTNSKIITWSSPNASWVAGDAALLLFG